MLRSLDPARVHRTVLSNGLTVLIHEDHSAPVAAVVTYVKAGYFDEPDDVVGIAHVLEHMYFKGTPARGVGEIARQTKASGGYLNAATIYDHTSYYAVLPIEGFDEGLAIQADAYANSLIDAAELARELEVIIEEAKRKEDSAGAVTTETLFELLHDRHRIRRWRIGREAPLRALRRDQLLDFYRNFYRPSNTVVVVAGDVAPAATLERIRRLYGALPGGVAERTPGDEEVGPPGRRYRERAGDIAETQIALGWRTPGVRHADTPLLDLAAAVLSSGRASRLYRAVRDRGLASSVAAYNYTPMDLGIFVLHVDGPAERAADAARAVWSEWRALRDTGIADSDLLRAKRLFESRWLRRFETMEGQANFLAEWEAVGDWRLGDEYAARVLAATPDEVTDAVRRHLAPEQASLMVYRPESAPAFADSVQSAFAALDAAPVSTLAPIDLPTTRDVPLATTTLIPERTHGHITVFRTPRGVPILVRRKVGTAIVHVGLYALGGTTSEAAEQAGIAALLARTSLRGTGRRTADLVALETELLGGTISPSVTSDGIGWTLSVTADRVAAGIDLLADVVLDPTVPAAAFDTERGVALSQLAQLRDDMMRYPIRLATEAAFGAHAYGRGILGSEATLRSVTAADALAWHAAYVRRSPCVLAVVGDVDPETVARQLTTAFAHLDYCAPVVAEAPPWPVGVVQRAESRDKAQTGLAIAFPGPSRRDDARIAAHLIAGVASGLGGRFFDQLRDKQSLAYTVHASSNDRLAAGMFLSYIATSPEKEDVARAGLLGEFARLRDDVVTDEELRRARTYALGTHAIAQQSGGNVLAELVGAWLYGSGIDELDHFAERLHAVTPHAMRELARQYFDPGRRVEGIVRGRLADPASNGK